MRLLAIVSWIIAVTGGNTGGIAFQGNQSISMIPTRFPTQTPVPARREQLGSPGETGTAFQTTTQIDTQSASYSSSPSASSLEESPMATATSAATFAPTPTATFAATPAASFAPTSTPSRNITVTTVQSTSDSNLGPIVGGSLAGTLMIGFLVSVVLIRRNSQRKRESLPLRYRRHTVANSVVTPNPVSTYSYNTKSESVLY